MNANRGCSDDFMSQHNYVSDEYSLQNMVSSKHVHSEITKENGYEILGLATGMELIIKSGR
jgi:hypothetical protein